MMKTVFVSLLIAGNALGAFLEGDQCGVYSSDFVNNNFTGLYSVAGDGCTFANNTNCLCAPDLKDGNRLSPWKWQCNGDAVFGPATGKVCPRTVPVIKSEGVGSVNFDESALAVGSPCNTTIHPTGRPGDEVCGYSECESGGKYSAVCGCVDYGSRDDFDPNLNLPMQWVCLHATCSCADAASTPTTTSSASATPLVVAATFASIVAFVTSSI